MGSYIFETKGFRATDELYEVAKQHDNKQTIWIGFDNKKNFHFLWIVTLTILCPPTLAIPSCKNFKLNFLNC